MPRASRSANKKKEESPEQIITTKRIRKPVSDTLLKEDENIADKNNKKVKRTQSDDKKVEKKEEKKPLEPTKTKKEQTSQMKTFTVSGSVPVDPYFPRGNASKVVEHKGEVYAATLNQTNISNNNNKFYILQIIQTAPNDYNFFCRWGRVGVVGQSSNMTTSDLNTAISQYEAKLRAKTKGGDYRIVEMNYEADDKDEKQEPEKKKQQKQDEPQVQSDLPDQVQNLIRLIFDMKMMDKQMKQIGYDAKKMPLGKLSKSSIEKGYEALKNMMDEVKGKKRKDKLEQFCNDFYSYIPHDFGFIKMQHFILDSQKKIKEKLEMLQSLQDIQVYTKILSEGKISSDINEIDSNYLKLNSNITPVNKKSETYEKLMRYVENTHGSTHHFKLQVMEIFEVKKEEEIKRYKSDIDNKQLLWHGSRLTNYVGILSQGLRIAPPEAPVTGYMFGKGVYLADMVTKSANYCCTNKTNNIGLMILCEAALGQTNDKFAADYYASNLPPGKDSTRGVGRTGPTGGQYIDGVWAPTGIPGPTGINYCALQYNEFVVYDIAQLKIKYLFKMRFLY